MRFNFLSITLLLCGWVAGVAVHGEDLRVTDKPRPSSMLVVSSYHFSHDASMEMIRRVRYRLVMKTSGCVIDYIELNAVRNSLEALESKFRPFGMALSSGKYDVVLVLHDDAINMLIRHADKLPENLPVVAYSDGGSAFARLHDKHRNSTGVIGKSGTFGALELGLKLMPSTRNLLVVTDPAGTGPEDLAALKENVGKRWPRLTARFIDGGTLSAGRLFDLAATMPPDSLIVFAMYRDYMRDGYPSIVTMAREFCSRASAPTLVTSGALASVGAVGAVIPQASATGEFLADQVSTALKHGDASAIPLRAEIKHEVVNVTAANRFGIDINRIPKTADRLNYSPSWLEKNKRAFVIWCAMVFFTLLIAGVAVWRVCRCRRLIKRERELWSTLPVDVLVLDGEGRILRGCRGEKGNAVDLYMAADKLGAVISETALTGQPHEFEHVDGTLSRHFYVTPLPVRLFGERSMMLTVSSRGVTATGDEKEKAGLLSAVFDSLAVGICVKDSGNDLHCVLANQTYSGLVGDGRAADAMLDPEAIRTMDLQALAAKRAVKSITEVSDVDDRRHFFEIVKKPISSDDTDNLVLTVIRDVTDDQSLEARQRKLIEDLNSRLESRRIINYCLRRLVDSDDASRAIIDILGVVGMNFEADACQVFVCCGDGSVDDRFVWRRDKPVSDEAGFAAEDLAGCIAALHVGTNVCICDTEASSPETSKLATALKKRGIRSALFAGVSNNGELTGFVGLGFCGLHHVFSDSEMRLFSEIVELGHGKLIALAATDCLNKKN
ncbi:MAG: PAS domain-containing protein [Victivallaceae bacterium]|nr:PAS domain-containing protein [Victivallaceae bacterium]